VAVTAALLVVLAGCSDRTPGTATPGDDPTEATETTTDTTTDTTEPSTSEPETGGLADVDPCAVVPQATLTGIGLTGGEAKTVGDARVCRYRFEGATLNDAFTVSVEILETIGLADVVGTNVTQLPKIGTHEATSFIDPAGVCVVSLGVSEKSRVDNAAVGGDQQKACQLAGQLAAAVEPELP
jgi:hypothetical protein